jgi:N-acetylneuraminic acid mutarotase
VVGGYTGTAPLRSVLAFTPGRAVREVARLPRVLRYAAVAAVGDAVYVAGGTSGVRARREVLRFDPRTRTVRRVARLPVPLTHAAAAALGGRLYVLGGRGDDLASQRAAVYALDGHRMVRAGRLPQALSDLGAATVGDRIVAVGGRDAAGAVHDEVLALRARP